jgi:hypothetical protein
MSEVKWQELGQFNQDPGYAASRWARAAQDADLTHLGYTLMARTETHSDWIFGPAPSGQTIQWEATVTYSSETV